MLVTWNGQCDFGCVELLAVFKVLGVIILDIFNDFLQLSEVSLEVVDCCGDNIRDFLDFNDVGGSVGNSTDLSKSL